MKIDAKVEFNDKAAEELGRSWFRVPVDIDYVHADEADIREWVGNELAEAFGRSISNDCFEITNMQELIEEINFDEFQSKAN